jgi:acetyltransferase-like isoleucine patch superfamily enzyme
MRREIARRIRRARYPIDPATGTPLGAVALEDAVACGVASVGRHTYGSPILGLVPGGAARVRIGSFTSIAGDVMIMVGGNHRIDWVTTFPLRPRLGLPGAYGDGHPAPPQGVIIGHDVWIGDGVLILDGTSIGNGAVVGARSVVTKDVAPYAIVAGNPAREVGRRFSDEQIEALQEIGWWEWPDEVVAERVAQLCDDDVDGFIRAYGGSGARGL